MSKLKGFCLFLSTIIISIIMIGCDGCSSQDGNLPVEYSGPVLADAFQRQIVSNTGIAFTNVTNIWDIGQPTETNLISGLSHGRYFQVPENASVGSHDVGIQSSTGLASSTFSINVLDDLASFPNPRIEDIGIKNWSEDANGNYDITLSVMAANGDDNATVEVNGNSESTQWASAYVIDVMSASLMDPTTFGYPIFHYSLYQVTLEGVVLGTDLNVEVINRNGELSGVKTYELPSTTDEFDSDGDGLLDEWEKNGYTAPSGAVIDLQALGCNYLVKDILVEVDLVSGSGFLDDSFETAIEIFKNAPIINPNKHKGINLIIDRGQGGLFTGGGDAVTAHNTIEFESSDDALAADLIFEDEKDRIFDADRQEIFRYAIIGNNRVGGSSGMANGIPSSDFLITLEAFDSNGTLAAQLGTFAHELGHAIGLAHGGLPGTADQNVQYKINQNSLMNYRYQLPLTITSGSPPTFTLGGMDNPQNCGIDQNGFFDFSAGNLAVIDTTQILESRGICNNLGIDLDCDGTISNIPTVISINRAIAPAFSFCSTIQRESNEENIQNDYDEWGNLQLDH